MKKVLLSISFLLCLGNAYAESYVNTQQVGKQSVWIDNGAGVPVVATAATFSASPAGYTTVVSGRKAVASAATAEKLVAATTACKRVSVAADLGNTNPVVVGGSTVVAANGSQNGIILVPGNAPVDIAIDDVSKLYVDAQTNGDAVCFVYYN